MGTENDVTKPASKIKMRRDVKDTVFRSLFSEPEYLLQLYQTLHPEDEETTVDDLKNMTLETVVATGIYNDLGFVVGNRLLILAESQSTWSVNIIIRSLMYLISTYQDYFDTTNQSVYSTKPLQMPEPELYVIYTGRNSVNKPEISFSDEFFGGKKTAIDVRVKVVVEGKENDILNQYIIFCKVVDEQVRVNGRTQEAILEAIRICKSKDVLKDYLESHEKEAVDMMMNLYNQEKITEDLMASERAEGRAEGATTTMLDNIKNLMINMKMTAEQAMQALGIPVTERARYQMML